MSFGLRIRFRRPARGLTWCLVGLLALAATASTAAELRRRPYLLAQRSDGIMILWRTDESVRHTAVVRYGSAPTKLDKVVQARENLRHHPGCRDWQVDITGLEPDTVYYYAVECDRAVLCGADDRHWFRTAPATGDRRPLRFWMLGDSGSNNPRADTIESVMAAKEPMEAIGVRNGFRIWNDGRPLDGIILVGDNSYPAGTDEQWQASFFNVYEHELAHTPLWPCTGNHDIDDAFHRVFPVNGRGLSGGVKSGNPHYYAADIGPLHLVVMDPWRTWLVETPEPDHLPWRRQVEWLEQDLAAAKREWTIVVQHFPPYTGGDYDSDGEPLAEIRRTLVPIFDRFGVDLSVSGHDHSYQRTYLLHDHLGIGDTFDPKVHMKSPSDGRAEPIVKGRGPGTGTVYVVAGMGGGSRRAEKFVHPAMVEMEDGSLGTHKPGSFVVEIDGPRLTGTLVDMAGKETDRFVMEHEGEKPAAR